MEWVHKGFKIEVSKQTGSFHAMVADVEVVAPSLQGAREAIDKEIASPKSKKTVALKVIGILDGKQYKIHRGTITGINRTTREFQVEGLPDGFGLDHVMADTPSNEAHLKRYTELHAACDEIDTAHRVLVLRVKGYGRLDLPSYEVALSDIQKSYNAQLGKAAK